MTLNNNYNYWFRTSLGLENIVLNELQEKTKIAKHTTVHRSLLVDIVDAIPDENKFFSRIRTADDVYRFIGSFTEIGTTKPSINNFFTRFDHKIIPILQKQKKHEYIRVTVSFLGKRSFNRFFIENAFNRLISVNTHFKVLSSEKKDPWKENELRLRCHIENDTAYFGIGIFDRPLHRRTWRPYKYKAQLHPPIAAAMARIAQQFNPKIIIDPFCGSGTILIESAIDYHEINYHGFDISKKALDVAKNNAMKADVTINFHLKNAFDKNVEYQKSVIVSNPPWGSKHLIEGKEASFVIKLCNIIAVSDGTVIIVPKRFLHIMKNIGFDVNEIIQTRILGKIAVIITIKKNNL